MRQGGRVVIVRNLTRVRMKACLLKQYEFVSHVAALLNDSSKVSAEIKRTVEEV